MNVEDLILDLEQHIEVNAPPEKAFEAVLYRLGKGNTNLENQSLDLQIEAKPGGRWFRDRGNGVGHLWGFVQVIKAPTLLEMSGPMFMSYPATNHVEVKVEPTSGGSRVTLRHRALGLIDPEHRKNVHRGWAHMLASVTKDCA